MSDFEKYIEAKYPNRSPKILFQKFKDIDGTLFYGVKEIEDQAEVWNHQQTIIDNLKAQLNNMETCYIEKKKELEGLQKTNISLEAGLRKNSKNKQKLLGKNIELQKQVDALKGLAQTFWEKSSEKHKQGKVWESKSLGECADEILDELEQALKGGDK